MCQQVKAVGVTPHNANTLFPIITLSHLENQMDGATIMCIIKSITRCKVPRVERISTSHLKTINFLSRINYNN
uniref:Uncharacterized protein n=1 Tax=Arundo donax TaxID=35708 RepID=A0A0A9HQR0_ARUDO